MANFCLRSHALSTSLRAAWRYFEHFKLAEHREAVGHQVSAPNSLSDIGILVRRDPGKLARLYLANPTATALALQWRQIVQRVCPREGNSDKLIMVDWADVAVPAGQAAYLDTVFQGEQPWVRQVRVKHISNGIKRVGSVHLTPPDMLLNQLPLTWEALS